MQSGQNFINVRSKYLSVILVLTFIHLLYIPHGNAAIKLGENCKKVGQIIKISDQSFTCTQKSNKLIWVKSTIQKPFQKQIEFTSVCDIDPYTPLEWREIEKYLSQITCPSFYKFVPYSMPSTQPSTALSGNESLLSIESCKITQPTGQFYPWRGFADSNDSQMLNYFKKYSSPRPIMSIQLIPIGWPDIPYSGSPKVDYGRYIDFLKSYIENISDVPTEVKYSIPDRYFQMPNPLDFYKDIAEHGKPTPQRATFWQDAIKVSDSSIDFSSTTVAILVVTPNTPIDKFGSNPDGNGISNEGDIPHILSLPPLNTKVIHRNSLFATPQMMIHELTHAGLDMGDYYNTGIWSHVGVGRFDPLGWDKYISGFWSDSQIFCVSPEAKSTHWIVPSSVKGQFKKLIVVPLSKNKVLVAESIRSAGYKYKLPKINQGVLVYSVDVTITSHGDGTDVYRAQFKTTDKRGQEDLKYDAPLKKGESVLVKDVKISVIETGDFGDVVKVEKV